MTHFNPRPFKPVVIALAGLLTLVAATSAAADPAEASAEAEILAMDRDGNGVLTATEHAQGAARMFLAMDADADGRVTAAEMEAHQAKTPRARDEAKRLSPTEKIAAVDGDRDGMLSRDEHAAGSERMFDTMDTNRDRTLDRSELATGHAKMLIKKAR